MRPWRQCGKGVLHVILERSAGSRGLTIRFDLVAAGQAEKHGRERAEKDSERSTPGGRKLKFHVRAKRPS